MSSVEEWWAGAPPPPWRICEVYSSTEQLDMLLTEIETQYRRLDPSLRTRDHILREFIRYLEAMQGVLELMGIGPRDSQLMREAITALNASQRGKRHHLFDPDAPFTPLGNTWLQGVQAEAAAILEHACADELGQQNVCSRKIVEMLASVGVLRPPRARRPAAPYTHDAVIKWLRACKEGRHQSFKRFRYKLAYFRKHAVSASNGLEDLRDQIQHQSPFDENLGCMSWRSAAAHPGTGG
jgi:hypothetical protein